MYYTNNQVDYTNEINNVLTINLNFRVIKTIVINNKITYYLRNNHAY